MYQKFLLLWMLLYTFHSFTIYDETKGCSLFYARVMRVTRRGCWEQWFELSQLSMKDSQLRTKSHKALAFSVSKVSTSPWVSGWVSWQWNIRELNIGAYAIEEKTRGKERPIFWKALGMWNTNENLERDVFDRGAFAHILTLFLTASTQVLSF